ncbi:MAG: TolC family outer membrane protein, partial [Rhizobacter sp.]
MSVLSLTRLALACGLALTAVLPARAETLAEVYEIARGYDATYLAARALADSAQYRLEQARAGLRPRVGLSADYTRAESESLQDSETRGPTARVQGSQPLFNRQTSVTIEQAERSVDVSMADLQTAEQELIVRVAQTYFDVLAAQDTLATARAGKAAISEQLASAKRNFEVGTATITDTREAQARFDLSTAQEIAAENDLRIKRLALDQLVGRAGVDPRPLAIPVVLPPMPYDVDSWVSQSESGPAVRKAQLGYDVAKLETEKARASHLPTFDLAASYGRGRTDLTSRTGPVTTNYNGGTMQSSVGVTMTLPLFAGFAVQNRVKETLSLEEQSRNSLDAARRAVAQATRTAYYGVQSGEAQVKALEAAESSSQLAVESTQLGYKVGVRVNIDVLNAQTQLYQTRRDLAKARYDVIVNSLRLRQAAGQLQPGAIS